MSATTFYNSTNLVGIGTLNAASVSTTLANVIQANIQSMNVSGDSNLSGNLITGNIIMASNLSTNSGQGNVYISANLVVNGNIFSIGGSVGSGSGTSQGVTYVLPSSYSLGTAFATGSAGPGIAGYHINMSLFGAQAIAAVSSFSASSGMLKFASAGLYSVQCVLVGDQPATKVGIGSTSSASFPPSVTATSGYVYVYNYPLNSSPTTLVTIPLTIQDTSKWYYLDAYFSTVSGSPSVLLQTAPPSGSAAGSNYGTYVQVGPFGNYLTSATGVASALLANCSASSTLSGSYSSNAYRVTLTSSNGWTVSGVSTSLAVTANGNFQVNQAGLYEVNMCLNTVGQTPVQFQVGSLSSDTLSPNSTTPAYLYTYAPMYTQDPTTVIQLPLNITNTSNVYFVEVSFQGTSTATIPLNTTSTFLSIKPIGSYVTPSTNPWTQQGTSVYYNSGPVGLGVVPTALTETLTVSGNTSFVGNVTQVTDASGSTYVTGKRTPAGSLSVANYVTGSVPLTTTTNLIQNYLSNAATISANTSTGTITQALNLPGTVGSCVNFQNAGSSVALIPTNTTNVFVEAWINPGVTSSGIIAAVGTSSQLWNFFLSSNYLGFNCAGGGSQTASSLPLSAGTWYHVAVSLTPALTTKANIWVNGTQTTYSSTATGIPAALASANVYIGQSYAGSNFTGNIADVRIWSGGIIPTTATRPSGFTAAAAPFGSTQPAYLTGTPTLLMSLNSQYFPGASTSPYGPCLTLPGTVGSYYSESTTALNTSLNSGFTIEAWVNYASLANANLFANGGFSYMIIKGNPTIQNDDWAFGVLTSGQISLNFYNSVTNYSINTAGTITTGSWNHLVAQANTTGYVNMYINGVQQTLQAGGYTGSGTAVALNGTVTAIQNFVTVGQYGGAQGPNFAIAKARVLFGANTYTTTTFTPSPNLGAVPSGATVAWQLETQYPLPTFPSIQDVTQLSAQTTAYGSLPTPVGGVTSNVLGPFGSSYPQLNSIRFDGTGYIDYGNAATSVMTTNIWASNWTIEGWVYPTGSYAGYPTIISRSLPSTSSDFGLTIDVNGILKFSYGSSGNGYYGYYPPYNTWTHIALVYDGTNVSTYAAGTRQGQQPSVPASMVYTPTASLQVGNDNYSHLYTGNLADVRVSNVARYTGSSYTVPTQPFASNDANTLLLLKSLGGQTGTTLEVQGRGLNAVSLGATRSVQSYPPAPMSSYLLDTTGNVSVSYGQGKYVASASSDINGYAAWQGFDITSSGSSWAGAGYVYVNGPYTGSLVTVDTVGNSYPGEWLQIQMPVSVVLSTYSIQIRQDSMVYYTEPTKWSILGSRDGINWSRVDGQSGISWASLGQIKTFSVSATQGYNFYRISIQTTNITSGTNDVCIQNWTLNGTEESLCITSDAKVGVGIANPQRALEVAGDLVVSGTISGGAGLGAFRNRIINGDMRIAQRGTSNVVGTTGQGNYMIDRFYASIYPSGTLILTQTRQTLVASDTPYQLGIKYSLRVASANGGTIGVNAYVTQPIEGQNGTIDLNWGTSFGAPVTLSFWVRTNAVSGTVFAGSITNSGYNSSYNFQYTATSTSGLWQYITFTLPPPPNGTTWTIDNTAGIILNLWAHQISPGGNGLTSSPFTWVSGNYQGTFAAAATPWWQTAGNYIEWTGVQLEKGGVSTPYEFRPYATELALCQRYYQQFNCTSSGGSGQTFGTGLVSTATSVYTMTPLIVPMRANSALSSNSAPNTFIIGTGASAFTPTSMSLAQASTNQVYLNWVVAAATASQPAVVQANSTTAAFLGFNAEL